MLSKQEIAGLRELLAKADVPPRWAVCGKAPNPYWVESQTIGAERDSDARRVADAWRAGDAALIVAAVNALPALLDIAEAVANAPEWDVNDYPPTCPDWMEAMDGKRVALVVLPLAGEAGNG